MVTDEQRKLIEHLLFDHGVAQAYDLTPEQCARCVVDLAYLRDWAIDLPDDGDEFEQLENWHNREHRALESDTHCGPDPTWALSCAYEFGTYHVHLVEAEEVSKPLDLSRFLPQGDSMPVAGVGEPPIITGHGSPVLGSRDIPTDYFTPGKSYSSPWMTAGLIDATHDTIRFRPIQDVPAIDGYGISREAREDYIPEQDEED